MKKWISSFIVVVVALIAFSVGVFRISYAEEPSTIGKLHIFAEKVTVGESLPPPLLVGIVEAEGIKKQPLADKLFPGESRTVRILLSNSGPEQKVSLGVQPTTLKDITVDIKTGTGEKMVSPTSIFSLPNGEMPVDVIFKVGAKAFPALYEGIEVTLRRESTSGRVEIGKVKVAETLGVKPAFTESFTPPSIPTGAAIPPGWRYDGVFDVTNQAPVAQSICLFFQAKIGNRIWGEGGNQKGLLPAEIEIEGVEVSFLPEQGERSRAAFGPTQAISVGPETRAIIAVTVRFLPGKEAAYDSIGMGLKAC